MYQVILSLGIGNFSEGHPVVSVQLFNHQGRMVLRCRGHLPPAPTLASLYEQWLTHYQSHYQNQDFGYRIELEPGHQPLRVSRYAFEQTCLQLTHALNAWFKHPGFAHIEQKLRTMLKPDDYIQILVETADADQRRFPWHIWDFLEDYPTGEIALSLPDAQQGRNGSSQTMAGTVRLLGVLGSPAGEEGQLEVDLECDRTTIQTIPQLEATFQDQPTKTSLLQTLWAEPWDILFIAGHGTRPHRDANGIFLNPHSEDNLLTAKDLKSALQNAVAQGLQLVILNACDSIGLASELAELDIAQVIAFRHAVPDVVAQTFLQYFLQAFSAGQSTYVALRQAREQLQSLDGQFPCASWLPVICHNPTVTPPSWTDLLGALPQGPVETHTNANQWRQIGASVLIGVGVLGSILGARTLGWLQFGELQAYDQFVRWQPPAKPDSRFLVITVDEADIQYQDQAQMPRQGSIAELALTQLLAKLNPHRPRVIGLDILHPHPFESPWVQPSPTSSVFIAPCEIGQTEQRPTTVPAAPDLPSEQLGFIDLAIDPDRVIRRQILFMDATPSCQTDQSLSLRVAQTYLTQVGLPALKVSEDHTLILGKTELRRLSAYAGGYQLPPDDALGYQILVNYRAASFPQVSLREVLSGALDAQLPNLVANRIILIGVVDGASDLHLTPTTGGAWAVPMAGVLVHAHMISHLISTAQRERPQIWWWSAFAEIVWISVWSLCGVIVLIIRPVLLRGMTIILILCCLITVSFLLLLNGGWIPFVPAGLGLVLTSIGTSMISKPMNLKPPRP